MKCSCTHFSMKIANLNQFNPQKAGTMFPAQLSSSGIHTEVEEEEEVISQKAVDIARGLELQMTMKSAIELGILDTISEANKQGSYLSASEVAAKIPGCVNPNAPILIDSMLSLLTSFSVLNCKFRNEIDEEEKREKVYEVTSVGKYFLTNKVDGSLGATLCMRYDEIMYKPWNHLSDAIKEGGIAFEKSHGMKLFERAEKEPRFRKVFNEAMADITLLIMNKLLDVYKGFQGIDVLVDVGGGTAASLMLITSKYPTIKGINFDLPHVVADAPTYPGVEHVGGDMFKQVPRGDAIFLKWILHNWSDEDCVRLLKQCWNALPSKGKVIVVEKLLPLIPENNLESQDVLAKNLTMFLTFGGIERTLEDYNELAMACGFTVCRPFCSAYNNWIIEFLKN